MAAAWGWPRVVRGSNSILSDPFELLAAQAGVYKVLGIVANVHLHAGSDVIMLTNLVKRKGEQMARSARANATSAALLIIAIAFPVSAWAQVAKYGETEEKGDYESYISQDGTHYKIGDKLKVGVPQGGNQTFTYVLEKVGFMSESTPCPARCAGLEYEVVGFRAGGKGQGFRMWAKMKSPARFTAALIVNFESALASGELIGRGYTSDQVLQELKKWKDKLDLELITKEEYKLKKEELSKYIR